MPGTRDHESWENQDQQNPNNNTTTRKNNTSEDIMQSNTQKPMQQEPQNVNEPSPRAILFYENLKDKVGHVVFANTGRHTMTGELTQITQDAMVLKTLDDNIYIVTLESLTDIKIKRSNTLTEEERITPRDRQFRGNR